MSEFVRIRSLEIILHAVIDLLLRCRLHYRYCEDQLHSCLQGLLFSSTPHLDFVSETPWKKINKIYSLLYMLKRNWIFRTVRRRPSVKRKVFRQNNLVSFLLFSMKQYWSPVFIVSSYNRWMYTWCCQWRILITPYFSPRIRVLKRTEPSSNSHKHYFEPQVHLRRWLNKRDGFNWENKLETN
jgi:hypothetical protein